jgi:hypothetical protein
MNKRSTTIKQLREENARLREALEWISKTTLRLIRTPVEEAEPAGCYCQIGRVADSALTPTKEDTP